MNIDWKKIVIVVGLALGVLGILMLIISLFQQAAQRQNSLTASSTAPFGAVAPGVPAGSGGGLGTSGSGGNLPGSQPGATVSAQMIFKITDGPVVSGTLVTAGMPTTTTSRFISAEDGHVYALDIDVAGAVPRVLSNITIPGVARAVWTDKGDGVLMQYLQGGTVKTVHLALFATTSTTTLATSAASPTVRFLPDDVAAMAASPDGKNVAYALHAALGSDIYIAASDGNNAKKLLSLPLSELGLSWPATSSLFLYTKSAGGAPGLGILVNAKTGATAPMLYGTGMTATVNPFLSHALYRTDTGTGASVYAEPLSTGQSLSVPSSASLAPVLPETCVWNPIRPAQAYCSAPVASAPNNYLELFHRGESSVASVLVSIDMLNPAALTAATPGSRDGGEVSNLRSLAISPDARYLSFVSKDDGKLWGVRLRQ